MPHRVQMAVSLLVAFGCTQQGRLAADTPSSSTPRAREQRLPVASMEPAPLPPPRAADQVCDMLAVTVARPSLEYVERPAIIDGQPNGPFVGMTWDVARPQGVPAVSVDGSMVVHWINGADSPQPAPDYTRELVVTQVDTGATNRTFRLLDHQELLHALPNSESPSTAAIQLANRRLVALSREVRKRVDAANAWLAARRWAPFTECVVGDGAHALRVGGLRVNLDRSMLEIQRADGTLLRREDLGRFSQDRFSRERCEGEPRLASVGVTVVPRVVMAVVALTPSSDSCSAPDQVRAYRLDGL